MCFLLLALILSELHKKPRRKDRVTIVFLPISAGGIEPPTKFSKGGGGLGRVKRGLRGKRLKYLMAKKFINENVFFCHN